MLCFLWCKINWNFPWGLVWILVHHILTSDVFGWDKKVEIIKGLPKSYLSFSQKSKIVVFSYSENCGFSSIAYLSEPVPHFFSYDKSQFFFFSIEESWMSFSLELGSDLVQNLFHVFFTFCSLSLAASFLQTLNHQICDLNVLDVLNVQRWQYLCIVLTLIFVVFQNNLITFVNGWNVAPFSIKQYLYSAKDNFKLVR